MPKRKTKTQRKTKAQREAELLATYRRETENMHTHNQAATRAGRMAHEAFSELRKLIGPDKIVERLLEGAYRRIGDQAEK